MANTKPQVTIFDCETQETIVRDANVFEIEQIRLLQQKAANDKAEIEAKTEAKAAAQAKLAALGLTVDDLQALGLGGN